MKRFSIGLLLVFATTAALAQQQTPDCQDVAFAIGYRQNEPTFELRTQIAHARDVDANKITRTPSPLTIAEAVAKPYPGRLIPEFEGKRLEPDETQVWEVTGTVFSIGSLVNRRGAGSEDFRICDTAGKCMDVSFSPPECVGDSAFGSEMLAVWQRQLVDEIQIGSRVKFRGVGYWCCENSPVFNLKPVIGFELVEDPGEGPGEEPVIPPDVTIQLPENVAGQPRVIGGGQSDEFDISTAIVPGFDGAVHLSVSTDAREGDNFSVTVSPQTIPPPGRGQAKVQINTTATTFPRDYLVTISALANNKIFHTTFIVKVTCDPPAILGIDQPRDVTVNPGVRATFRVKPLGTGPFQYQWYRGRRGSTVFPIANATTDTLEVTSVDDVNLYWVRVSNACGTVDSTTVSIAPAHRRSVRR